MGAVPDSSVSADPDVVPVAPGTVVAGADAGAGAGRGGPHPGPPWENSVSWLTSRTRLPAILGAGGWGQGRNLVGDGDVVPGGHPLTAHGALTTTLAMMAVERIVGAGRRDDIARCYVCASWYWRFDTG